jgi:hypothetical protein
MPSHANPLPFDKKFIAADAVIDVVVSHAFWQSLSRILVLSGIK